MAVNLNAPLAWEKAADDDLTMLKDLQPNIVKAHTRDHLTILFLRFGEPDEAASLLAALASLMKSAHAHLEEIKAFKADGPGGTPYVGVGISAAGYDALGVPEEGRPTDESFRSGMRDADLGDDLDLWEPHFDGTLHAVVLVGDATPAGHDAGLTDVNDALSAHPGVAVAAIQKGVGLHNANGDGIEHFGYVDGRSQPLFLVEDIDAERLGRDGATTWDPAFALGRVIVPDPAAPDPTTAFGSYFIFRKLEQDVKLFKEQEDKLADDLGLEGDDRDRAGALIVGRFEDGTPVTAQWGPGGCHPVPNDFDYSSDADGGKCPFFGHIRKLNPRGSGKFEEPEEERLHLMARRGQTYGHRADNPNDEDMKSKPVGDVGLLFMAFNVNIGEQFEFTQQAWANSAGFPEVPEGAEPPGIDLVIGQGARPDIEAPKAWGAARPPIQPLAPTPPDPGSDDEEEGPFRVVTAPKQAVTARGGEYFFMPSLSFLRSGAAMS